MTNYGYRIMRESLIGSDKVDPHIGAYGFESEEMAVEDAKRRLEKEIKPGAIFKWSIQSYAYEMPFQKTKNLNTLVLGSAGAGRAFHVGENKECVNET